MDLSVPVVAVCGTRPEFIKIAPVMRELERRGVPNWMVLTGQHQELVEGLCDFFEIRSYSTLQCHRQGRSLNQLLSVLLAQIDTEVSKLNASLLLVQGDTTSALAGALVGFHSKLPVAHIEAGLRTGDLRSPFPEEANRKLISQIAELHFTPTLNATRNLIKEGIPKSTIYEVGNTIVDATNFAVAQLRRDAERDDGQRYSVVTVHRRESWDENISSILSAIRFLANENDSQIIKFVMHANPMLQSRVFAELGGVRNIELVHPLPYPEFVALISGASMILSDSGGIQEEAPSIGVPTVILRDKTERPEAILSGACRIGGTSEESIIRAVSTWQRQINEGEWVPATTNPFGDGNTSKRITDILEGFLLSHWPSGVVT